MCYKGFLTFSIEHAMQIYGHRGAKGVAMENSLEGFTLAAEQGINQFELDIRLSADQQLMVVHDEKLKRLANSPLLVSQSSANKLSNTLLTGTNQGIPTLEQVVAACPNVIHWQFEIKTQIANPKFVRPIKAIIKKYNLENKVVVTSQHVGTLAIFKRLLPSVPRGYVQEWPLPSGIGIAQHLDCQFLILNKKLASKKRIKKAQNKGINVSVWTVNEVKDMIRMKRNGANSIISDFPQLAAQQLNQF